MNRVQVIRQGDDLGYGVYKFYRPCKIVDMWKSGSDVSIRLSQEVITLYEGLKSQKSNRYISQYEKLKEWGIPDFLCNAHKVYKEDFPREATIILPHFVVQEEGLSIGSEYDGFIEKVKHQHRYFPQATQMLRVSNGFSWVFFRIETIDTSDIMDIKDEESLKSLCYKNKQELDEVPDVVNWILNNDITIIDNYFPEYVWRARLSDFGKEVISEDLLSLQLNQTQYV